MKRFLAFLMTFVLMLGTIGVTAYAEEVESTDPYTLYMMDPNYANMNTSDGEPSPWRGFVTSPFYVGKSDEVVLFELVDKANNHSIETFCVDVVTAIDTARYQRINLEDSSYFGLKDAQRIRAIVNNGVTVKSLEDMQEAANQWLKNKGKPEIIGLTGAEALSATQYAIWYTANADNMSNTEVYDDYYVPSYSSLHASKYGDLGDTYVTEESHNAIKYDQEIQYAEDGTTNLSKQNIEGLAAYLLSLEPQKAKEVAVSNNALQNLNAESEKQEDGTYTATITFTIDNELTIDEADLTISVSTGDNSFTEKLQNTGKHTMTLTGLTTDDADIKVEINGEQKVSDVFFFEAEGGRKESQTLVGIDSCKLPVHAEASVNPSDRVIEITKTTPGEEEKDRKPLKNIQFSIYKVGSLDDYLNGNLTIGEKPTEDEVKIYKTEDNFVATITTDSDGIATYNFGNEDAVYLVIEEENPAVEKPVDPFFVAVPMVDPSTGKYDYTVTVQPKNTVVTEEVTIKKDVTEIGNDTDSFDVNENHTWIIQSSIPAGMANGLKYEITDVLDYRLTYKGNVKVTVANSTTSVETELVEDVDYSIAESKTNDAENHEVDKLVVSLTKAGRKKAAANSDEVRVYFDAVINTNAVMGEEIPNDAHVDYTNNVGMEYEDDSDEPVVYTCGINVLKVAADDKELELAGATFKLAKEDAEGAESLVVNGKTIKATYVDFYNNAEREGDKVNEVVTGEKGTAILYGLEEGTYYLVETKAPEGYNKLTAPVVVELNKLSHITEDDAETPEDEDNTIEVVNSKRFVLPATGGMGTTLFIIIGIALVGAAVVLLVSGKKNKA